MAEKNYLTAFCSEVETPAGWSILEGSQWEEIKKRDTSFACSILLQADECPAQKCLRCLFIPPETVEAIKKMFGD